MNIVRSIDEKMWASIKTLQTAATWLDPTLKSFTFLENATDCRRLLSDAERMVLSQSSAAVERLQRKLEDTIEIKELSVESPPSIKRSRLDPLAQFRNTAPTGTFENEMFDIHEEIQRYKCLSGAKMENDDPLKWWGKNCRRFPVMAAIAKTFFVIPASSSESERHFSAAGRVAKKDRNRLKPDILEAQVIVADTLKIKLP